MITLLSIFKENYKTYINHFEYYDETRTLKQITNPILSIAADTMVLSVSALLTNKILSNAELFEIHVLIMEILHRHNFDDELCTLEATLMGDLYDMLKLCEEAEEYEVCNNIHMYINGLFLELD